MGITLKRLLVANRGEIAMRVMASARRLGLATIAVHSDADAGALHVRSADEAWRLGPAPPLESYLSIERIIEVARRAGADAIHPGYGFLSERADFAAACAAAKEHGGGRFRVTLPDSDESRLRTAVMRSAMRVRAAIDERRFVPYCQSIVPLRAANDGRRHFEVLLRMVEPDGGILPPAEFIAAAERYQLGPRLDRHVIDLVLDWLEQHPDAARDIGTCSINLGGGTLVDDEFRDDLHARLRRGRFPPDKLCLEITETSVARDRGRAQRFIGRMRELGCRFALDDFGTGFCSFSYLRDLDVDFLKIDGSFVRDMDSSPLAGAVVRSITDIAHVLDKRAIAEHVEDLRQREALAAIGVDYMQGYAIDRPMPPVPITSAEVPAVRRVSRCRHCACR